MPTSERVTFVYTTDELPRRFTGVMLGVPIKEVKARVLEALRAALRRQDDRIYQAMQNNLWSYNPGELDRWADDGGQNV